MNWTVGQISALAPDSRSFKAGNQLATPHKWLILGQNKQALWGECPGSGKKPYQTQIDLSEPAFKCSCPSRKFPCKHALGLFVSVRHQDAFTEAIPPERVTEWLATRARRDQQGVQKTKKSGKVKDTAAQARRAAQREEKVEAGLEELQRWLLDLAREGLALGQGKPQDFWTNPTARMIDAQAPGLAARLGQIAASAYSGENWQERLLEHIGTLHLLLEGYKRLETLPEAVQQDIRTLIGWSQSQDALLTQSGIKDRWGVVGQRIEQEERLKVQRTWLRGQATSRSALLLHFASKGQPLDSSLVPGTTFEAEVVFYPGSYPLRALIKEHISAAITLISMTGYATLIEFISAYAEALAVNPWLEQFPVTLQNVIPFYRDEAWFLKDKANQAIPLPPKFNRGWQLLAVSGGQAVSVFGEWDGRELLPLSMFADGRFVGL